MRKLSLCMFALCLGFASITHAAPTVTKMRFKGSTASGTALSGDDGCFSAILSVTASDEVTKDSTGTTTSKTLVISYNGRDLCNSLSFGGRQATTLTIGIANQSSVTFPFDFLVDYVNTDTSERFQKRITGSVTITATGEVERTQSTEMVHTQEQRSVTRSKGNTREASLTVDAKLDGVPQSLPITSGELGTITNGTIDITHY